MIIVGVVSSLDLYFYTEQKVIKRTKSFLFIPLFACRFDQIVSIVVAVQPSVPAFTQCEIVETFLVRPQYRYDMQKLDFAMIVNKLETLRHLIFNNTYDFTVG